MRLSGAARYSSGEWITIVPRKANVQCSSEVLVPTTAFLSFCEFLFSLHSLPRMMIMLLFWRHDHKEKLVAPENRLSFPEIRAIW